MVTCTARADITTSESGASASGLRDGHSPPPGAPQENGAVNTGLGHSIAANPGARLGGTGRRLNST